MRGEDCEDTPVIYHAGNLIDALETVRDSKRQTAEDHRKALMAKTGNLQYTIQELLE